MAADPKLCNAEFRLAERFEFNADSVEWCPFPQWAQLLACGTYELNTVKIDASQTRDGNIVLYKLTDNSSDNNLTLDKTFVVDSGGILDMKWCPELINDAAVLGVACSNGNILLLRLCEEEDSICFKPLTNHNSSEEIKKMILSLDWTSQPDRLLSLVASDTAGDLNYFVMRESELCILENWNAHQFESWIAAFDYSQPYVIYSGGDDCCLKCWDIRSIGSAVFVNKRHSMGVTAISKSKKNEHILATGSYDENIFLWDVRSMKVPASEIALHGGIWRLKWHPYNPTYILSASMHNGFHLLSTADCKLEIKTHYDKHESLAYGVDWCYLSSKQYTGKNEKSKFQNLVASCSFYDKLMHVWQINL